MNNNCVETALEVVESLKSYFENLRNCGTVANELKNLKDGLKYLRTFYYMLCGIGKRKCLPLAESILLTIEEAVLKHSLEIQFMCLCLNLRDEDDDNYVDSGLTTSDETKRDLLSKGVSDFLAFFDQEKEEMERMYQIFTEETLFQCSSSFVDEEFELLICVIDSLLPNLRYLLHSSGGKTKKYYDQFETYIKFLKSLILFAKFRELEYSQMEDLLIHIGDVVVYVARFTFLYKKFGKVDPPYNVLHKISPFRSKVCRIYVGVLQKLCMSQSSYLHPSPAGRHTIILANCLFQLLSNVLCSYSGRKVTFSHQMQNLLGVLLYSMSIRMEKTHDLFHVVICKAAIIFCYIMGGERRCLVGMLKLLFLDMEENFKLMKVATEEEKLKIPLFPPLAYPQTNLLGFIDSVLEKLKSVITYEADSLALSNDKFQTVHCDLQFLRSFLVDATTQPHQNRELQALIASVAYEMEFVLDSSVIGDHDPHGAVELFNTIIERIKLTKAELSETIESKRQITAVQSNLTTTHSKLPWTGEIPALDELVVGLTDEAQQIIDRLERGTRELDIVSIVGMPGLGKTTLAKKVYSHESIIHHFHVRSWCCVSQGYEKKTVLLAILRGLDKIFVDQLWERSEDDLAEKLYKELKGKRYLILLDDIWDVAAWNSLKSSFPNDGKGSRILLTSRNRDIALQIKPNREPHSLRSLTNDESWELLQNKICLRKGYPPELLARGEAIAKDCKGLPLMILIVGGLLSNMEPDTWEEVAEKLRKGTLSIPDQYMETLELSYLHLPNHLKPCFLYFGAFQEDQKIYVGELLRLWIAEGFVVQKKTTGGDHHLEDVARGYMMELIQRSLVMVGEKGSRGGRVKTCILHDLLLEFCKAKCKEEHFMHCLHEYELATTHTPVEERKMPYRLRVECENIKDFAESRLLFIPQVRTLFIPDYEIGESTQESLDSYSRLYTVIQRCKVLRVFECRLALWLRLFPREIGQLVHLKYLALTFMGVDNEVMIIPSSFGNLLNLETFIIMCRFLAIVRLPETLWNMKKLRHLRGDSITYWELPKVENLDDDPNLENLQTLCNVKFYSLQEMEVMRKFPNIRKSFFVFQKDSVEQNGEILELDFMGELESLYIRCDVRIENSTIEFSQNLKKLTLSGLRLEWNKISAIDGLPKLEILKLEYKSFEGQNWEVEEGDGKFPKLRVLELSDLELVRWITSLEYDDDSFFPCLEKLILRWCVKLEQVPISCLANHSSLQMIEVVGCSRVKSSMKQIEEEKTNNGNEDLKIIIRL